MSPLPRPSWKLLTALLLLNLVPAAMTRALVVSVQAEWLHRIAKHSAPMLRAWVLCQRASTQVLLRLLVSLPAGAPTRVFCDALMAAAWELNLVFAEWTIRRRLPSP